MSKVTWWILCFVYLITLHELSCIFIFFNYSGIYWDSFCLTRVTENKGQTGLTVGKWNRSTTPRLTQIVNGALLGSLAFWSLIHYPALVTMTHQRALSKQCCSHCWADPMMLNLVEAQDAFWWKNQIKKNLQYSPLKSYLTSNYLLRQRIYCEDKKVRWPCFARCGGGRSGLGPRWGHWLILQPIGLWQYSSITGHLCTCCVYFHLYSTAAFWTFMKLILCTIKYRKFERTQNNLAF
jgi:hypothetical protein